MVNYEPVEQGSKTIEYDISNLIFDPSDSEISLGEKLFSGDIRFIFGMQNLTAVIMNRWGEKIYEFNDMYDVWDGYSLSGQEVPDGVYFYILESQGEDGSPYSRKGSVTLIR